MKDITFTEGWHKRRKSGLYSGIFKAHFPKETMLLWLSILPFSSSFVTCQSASITSERAVEVSKPVMLWLSEEVKLLNQ